MLMNLTTLLSRPSAPVETFTEVRINWQIPYWQQSMLEALIIKEFSEVFDSKRHGQLMIKDELITSCKEGRRYSWTEMIENVPTLGQDNLNNREKILLEAVKETCTDKMKPLVQSLDARGSGNNQIALVLGLAKKPVNLFRTS